MSTTVDDRIVSMQFDNAHFEKNVSTTLSTLDKLKQSLNLTGAAKGLDGINNSVKNVNLNILSDGVQKVQASFSALEVMGVTALANITNSAVNAGKRIASALTIEPIKTGFQEYETQINAVQTILANTQSKGSTIDDVNKALDELNLYADKTIYNFTEMTRNIGTFTAAGVDLETSVNAIQGIANLAAVSGSTSQQASTAMYQLSQALAAGTVKLMDWNSVVNAGMGGQIFQDALKKTSEELGTGAEAAIKANGSFRESLQTGWITSEVLTETLKKFTTSGANEYVAEYTGLTTDAIEEELKLAKANYEESEAIDKAAEALAKKSGKNKQEIKEALQLANTAEEAATKVKTFTQLWDVIKESVQSGWSQTWELIIGDYEQAKNLLSPISDFITGIIGKISDARNKLIQGALEYSPFGDLIKQVSPLAEKIETVTEAVKDYEAVVNRVLSGDFGNGQARWDKLTEQGYDWAHVQNLVNERMGDGTRHATKYAEAQNEVTKSQGKTIEQLSKMSDAQLKEAGLTKEEIASLRMLRREAALAGMTIEEFIDKYKDAKDGRTLLIESFKNAGQGLVAVLTAIKDAWVEVFPPMTSMQLYNIIYGLNQFSQHLKVSDKTADKLKRTLKGVFALLDIALTIIGGPIKIALKVVSTLLGMFNLNWLDATAAMGDAIVAARDWIDANNPITKILKYIVEAIKDGIPAIQKWADENDIYNKTIGKVTPLLKNASTAIKNWVENNVDFAKGLKTVISFIKNAASAIGDWLAGIKDAENIPKYIIDGLVNGLLKGTGDVLGAIRTLGSMLIDGFCKMLGIASPSKVFIALGGFIIAGLVAGLTDKGGTVLDTLKTIFDNCMDFLKNLDFGTVLAGGILIGGLLIVKQISDTVSSIAAPLEGVGDMLTGIGKTFNGVGSVLRSQAVMNMAISIAILAGSVIALTMVPTEKLWSAIGAITVLSAIIGALSWVAGKADKTVDFGKSSLSILAIAGSLLILAAAVKLLSTITVPNLVKSVIALGAIIAALIGLMWAIGKFVNGEAMKNIDKAGIMIIKMSIAMVLMIGVIKLASNLDGGAIAKGISVVRALTILFGIIIAVSQLAGEHASKAGGMLLKMSLAMLIMISVIKLASKLDAYEIIKGIFVVGMLEALFITVIAVSKLAGEHGSKAGSMIFKMAIAFAVMVGVIKLISKLDDDEIMRGIGVMAAMEVLFISVIAVSRIAGQNASKAGSMLFKMSAALLILAGVMFILSLIKPDGLARALGAISVLEALFIGLIGVTAIAKDSKDMSAVLTRMIITIALLVGSLVILTLLDPAKLDASVKALTAVMVSFAGLLAATKLVKNTKTMRKTMMQMLLVVAGLALIVAALSLVDGTKALPSCAALSILLLSLASSLAILGVAGRISTTVSKQLAPMLGVVFGLALILGVMSALDVEASISSALALGILLNAMSTAMVVLGAAKGVNATAVGTMALMALVVGELGLIMGLLAKYDLNTSIDTAMSLSVLLMAMSAALIPLTLVGLGGPAALIGIGTLVVLIAAMGAIFAGIGALMTEFPELEAFIDKGLPLMEKLCTGIGSCFGSLIGGALAGISSGLPAIGENLSLFMENLSTFVEGAKQITPESMEGVRALSEVFLILTAAQFLEGIGKLLGMDTGLDSFGDELVPFGEDLAEFSKKVKDVDGEAIGRASTAAKKLAEAADALPLVGGMLQDLIGGKSLSAFGETLEPFGEGLVAYSKSISELKDTDLEHIKTSADAAKNLAELSDALPLLGGMLQELTGTKSLATFGETLEPFGKSLISYSRAVQDLTEEDIEHIKTTVIAAEALAKLSDSIEPIGGLITFFVGANDLDSFGGCIRAFGISLSEYSESIGTVSIDNINASVDAVLRLCELQDLASDRLYVVAGNINGFGEELSKFYDETCDINIGSLQSVATATTLIVNAINHMCDIKNEAVDKFKSAISKLLGAKGSLTKLGEFKTSNLSNVVTHIGKVGKMLSAISITDISGAKTFVQTLKDLSNIDTNGISKSFGDMASSMKKFATKIINSLNEGFTGGADKTKEALNNIKISLNSFLLTGIFYNLQFYSFGKNVVMGFVNGISENTYKAEAKARAMAAKAAAAAKAALNEHSPSKVFHEIGSFAGLGFVNGLDAYQSSAYSSGAEVATYAKKGLSEAINRVANYIDGDMDMQPTIRPVLDLSEVSNGVGAINGMFGGINPSVKALSNIGTISTMMNRNQNGTNNSEVISAINDLGKRLGTPSSNTYNINGVTYDDGSNVKDAVETLIRAAIVERRR